MPNKEPVIRKLANFISSISFENIPPKVVAKAKDCIIDTLGCALGASKTPEVVMLINAFRPYLSPKGVSIWGSHYKTNSLVAAVLNGTMGHSLEMDDVHRRAKCHAGTVVIPTAITLGEAEKITGKDLITAVVCGYEIMLRVGVGIGAASHRQRGWHATGTCGTFGAAAAAGKIMGLSSSEMSWAFGLAGTQSSGLWAFTADGAGNKKFHAGRAAESGILAAILAKGGITGPEYILEAKDGGLFYATSDEFSLSDVVEGLGEHYMISDVSMKPYACCRSIHPAIDAVLELRKKGIIEPNKIKKINVRTYSVAVKQCGFTKKPKNVAEAQFCLAYGVAVALIDGNALIEQFSNARVTDEKVGKLASIVEVINDPKFDNMYPEKWGCEVQIELVDGLICNQEVTAIRGDPETFS
jgi:2-methylcitrate dehydratase PrpD